jgi:predicted HAD superfamily Cof-like phosphohydrolase
MVSSLDKVAEFHKAFGVETRTKQGFPEAKDEFELRSSGGMLMAISRDLNRMAEFRKSTLLLRLQLIVEEAGELAIAMSERDMKGCLDALCDLRYVCDGTTLSLGLRDVFWVAFAEVHNSNMSKLDAEGKPVIEKSGRVGKSDKYIPPDLDWFIN